MALDLDEIIAKTLEAKIESAVAKALGAEETEAAEEAAVEVEETSRETYSKSGESGAA